MSENYDIKIGFDASKAEKGLDSFDKGIQAVLRGMGKLDKTAASAFAKLDKAASGVSFGDLAKAAGRATSAVNRTSKAAADAGGNLSRLSKHAEDLTRDLKATEAQAKKTAAALAKISGGAKRGRPAAANANSTAGAVGIAVKDATNVAKLATQQQKLSTATAQTATATQHLAKATTQAAAAQAGLATAQQRTVTATVQTQAAMQKLAQQTAKAATEQQKLATAQQQTIKASHQAAQAATQAQTATTKLNTAQAQHNNTVQRGATLAVKHMQAQQQTTKVNNDNVRSYYQASSAKKRDAINNNQLQMSEMRLAKQKAKTAKEASLLHKVMNSDMFSKLRGGTGGAIGGLRGLENAFSASYQAASLFRTALGAITLGSLVSSIQQTGQTWAQFRMTVDATATSATEAAEQQAFLLDMVKRVPIPLAQAAEGFRKFSVGARMSGVSVKDMQTQFEGLATAFVGLGATPEQMDRAMLAFSQMMSKGTVMAEELKGQMAEAIAGSGPLMAKAMDMTMAKLAKTMEAGMLKSKDALPLFTKTLQETFEDLLPSALNTSGIQLVKFSNNLEVLKMKISQGGFETGLVSALQGINKVLEGDKFADIATKIGEGFGTAFKVAGAAAVALAQNIDAVIQAITYIGIAMAVFTGFSIIGSVASTFLSLVGVLGVVGKSIMFLTIPLRAVGIAAGLTNAAMAAIPIAVIGGIAVLLYGLSKLDKAFGLVTDAMNVVRNAGRAMLEPILIGLNKLGGVSDEYLAEFRANTADVNQEFKNVGQQIEDAGKDLWDRMKALVPGAAELTPNMQGIVDAYNNAKSEIEKNEIKVKADAAGIKDLDRYAQNAKDIQKNLADAKDELAELTKGQQKLFDKVSPITKARKEYDETIKLLDELERRGKAGEKGGITPEQRKALQERNDYLTLEDRDPYAASVRGLNDEIKLLKLTNAEREVERKVMQAKNDLMKAGYANADQLAESLRKTYQYMEDLEKGGSNGFQRWSNSLKDFRESLIDVEQNALEGLSDQLTDLVTTGKADFASLGESILRSINKAIIDKMMKNFVDSMNIGKDGILGALFGTESVTEDQAKKDRDKAIADKLPESTVISDLMEVTAGTVNINGEPFGPYQPGKGFGAGPGQGEGFLKDALRGDDGKSLREATTSQMDGLRGANDNGAAGLRTMTTTATKAATAAATTAAGAAAVKAATTWDPVRNKEVPVGPSSVAAGGLGPVDTLKESGFVKGVKEVFGVSSAAAATMPMRQAPKPFNGAKSPEDFAAQAYEYAREAGLNDAQAKISVAQSALETGWGKSVKGNNFHGIKAGKSWEGKTQDVKTWEVENGRRVNITDKFRAYDNPADSFRDWKNVTMKQWPEVGNASTTKEAIAGLRAGQKGGYATDPQYGAKLESIIARIDKSGAPARYAARGTQSAANTRMIGKPLANEQELAGVNNDLQAVVRRANEITKQPFKVGDGLRTLEEQRGHVRKGVSKTMNSRHLTGEAVDLWATDKDGKVNWDKQTSPAQLTEISKAMKQASGELGVPIEWGGDWKGGWDKPHYQLPKGYKGSKYPNGVAPGSQGTFAGDPGVDTMTTGSITKPNSIYGASAYAPGAQLRGSVDTAGIDSAKTSVEALNSNFQTLSTTTSTTLRPSITDLGGQTQIAGSAALQASTGVQQASTSLSTVGSSAQSAGSAATNTGTQFDSAATAIQQAGVKAQAAGQQANFFGLSANNSGVQLAGMAQQTAQVGNAAQQSAGGLGGLIQNLGSLLQSLFSGGGGGGGGGFGGIMSAVSSIGGMFGLFSEGGVSTSPVSMGSTSSLSAWSGAPRYAQGTAEAQRSPGSPKMHGGFPAVLHDNEAVIPLTRGRSVPVEMSTDDKQVDKAPRGAVYMTVVTPDASSFRKSKTQIQSDLAAAQNRSAIRNN